MTVPCQADTSRPRSGFVLSVPFLRRSGVTRNRRLAPTGTWLVYCPEGSPSTRRYPVTRMTSSPCECAPAEMALGEEADRRAVLAEPAPAPSHLNLKAPQNGQDGEPAAVGKRIQTVTRRPFGPSLADRAGAPPRARARRARRRAHARTGIFERACTCTGSCRSAARLARPLAHERSEVGRERASERGGGRD